MPSLEVTLPKIEASVRKSLAEKLTDILAEQPGFDREILGICFHEYGIGEAAMGGKIWDGSGKPYLHMILSCPRISKAAKQNIVRGFTDAVTKILSQADWKPIIHISEHPYDNIGVEGELLSDLIPELRDRKFYYELSKDQHG